MASTEETVQQEQHDHDARQASPFADLETQDGRTIGELEEQQDDDEPADTPPDPEGEALFDRSAYEREDPQIPKMDGQGIDKIRVKFAGSVMLDRSDPADVNLYNRLTLGQNVELRCAGKVSGTGVGWTTNRDGDLDAIVGERSLKVETVWVLDPESL